MYKKLLFFLLLPVLGMSQVQIGQDIDGENAGDRNGYSVSLSADGKVVAMTGGGGASIYQNVSGTWTLNGTFPMLNSAQSVSLSSNGEILAIGNTGYNNGNNSAGYVQVYQNVSGVWTQIGNDIDGDTVGEHFGFSVSLSSNGTTLAVGAPYYDGKGGTRSGQVRVYQNVSGNWIQLGQDIDDGEFSGEFSGWEISLSSDGDILAVGRLRNSIAANSSGLVRVYRNVSGNWIQIGQDIVGEGIYDTSAGVSLSADGSVVAIGAPHNNNVNGSGGSGHVRIYRNISGNWFKIGADIDGEGTNDNSGYSVSLSADGNVVAIGAPNNNDNGNYSGHVRIYKNISGNWIQAGIDIDGEAAGDRSGSSISLSADGKTVAIGASGNSGNGNAAGHVRVYDISNLSSNDFVLENFNIYPNPTSDILNIRLENNLTLEKVTIYNNLGQIVKTTQQSTVDVSNLSSGIYFVEVTTNQGKAVKKVIVK